MAIAALLGALAMGPCGPHAGAQTTPIEVSGPGIRVHHAAESSRVAARVLEAHPALRDRTARRLGFELPGEVDVYVVRDHDDFNALIRQLGGAARPPFVAAVAFGGSGIIVLKTDAWTGRGDDFEAIFQHELVHCFLGHLMRENPNCRIPVWFNEGVAQWVTERVFLGDADAVVAASHRGTLLSFEALREAFPDHEGASSLAYGQSLSLVRYVSRHGAENEEVRGNIRWIIRLMAGGKSLERATVVVTGRTLEELEAAWRGELASTTLLRPDSLLPFLFGGFVLVTSILLFATLRVRRERRLSDWLAEEASAEGGGEEEPPEQRSL